MAMATERARVSRAMAMVRKKALGCAFRFVFWFLPGLIFRNPRNSVEFHGIPPIPQNTRRN